MTRYSAWGLRAWGGAGVFLLLACGGTVKLREGESTVGGASAGGATAGGGTQQLAGIAGSGQTPAFDDPCVRTLEELCASSQCPASPADLLDSCTSTVSLSSTPTDCNGTVVSSSFGFGATSWYFDANDALTGALITSDTPSNCADGHQSFNSLFGASCAAQGEPTDACVPAEGCAPAPLVCDDCPAHPDVVLANYCGLTSTLSLTTTPTTCGGSVLVVQTTSGDLRYCFDNQGRLVGSMSRPAATGVETPSGSECIADGMPIYACADDPG